MTDYKVKFEVFEGLLDLLLYLIKKEEVDIYEVNLTRLATQFRFLRLQIFHIINRISYRIAAIRLAK